jgi:hypothetical protein
MPLTPQPLDNCHGEYLTVEGGEILMSPVTTDRKTIEVS